MSNIVVRLGPRQPYYKGGSPKDFFCEVLVDFPEDPKRNATLGWYAVIHRTDCDFSYHRVFDDDGDAIEGLGEFFLSEKKALEACKNFLVSFYAE